MSNGINEITMLKSRKPMMVYRLQQLAVVSACLSALLGTGTAKAEVTLRAIST